MTMTSVSTPASSAPALPPGPAASSRQTGNPGNPFQQMLTDEIRGKTQNNGRIAERNTDSAASGTTAAAPASEKSAATATNPALEKNAAADKNATTSSEAGTKEETADTAVPMLSPELAAIVASLLQRQTAAADGTAAEKGEQAEADPLTLLGKGTQRQNLAEPQFKGKDLQDAADPRLAPASDRAQATGAQSNASSRPDLDLQLAAGGKQVGSDATGKDGRPSEFNSVLQQLNQTSQTAPARTAQPSAQAHLAPRVGTQGWDQALGQRVVWMASGAEHSASLTLNPPELGPLQVTLNVSNSQATATFVAPHADVRQALEAAMPKLREMLGEVGIQLDQASVNHGTPQQQGEFARSGGQRGSQPDADGGLESPVDTAGTINRVSAGNGLVDTFA